MWSGSARGCTAMWWNLIAAWQRSPGSTCRWRQYFFLIPTRPSNALFTSLPSAHSNTPYLLFQPSASSGTLWCSVLVINLITLEDLEGARKQRSLSVVLMASTHLLPLLPCFSWPAWWFSLWCKDRKTMTASSKKGNEVVLCLYLYVYVWPAIFYWQQNQKVINPRL